MLFRSVTCFSGSFTTFIEYGVLPISPLIGYLHEMGDGFGFYPTERLLELQSVDPSSERVYRVIVRYPLGRIIEEGPALDVLA